MRFSDGPAERPAMRLLPRLAALASFPAAVLLPALPVQAHPHAWIDMRTAMVFDDRGRVAALRVDWLFDEIYSLYSTEELDDDGDGRPDDDRLVDFVAGAIERLEEYGYFSVVQVGERQAGYGPVTEFDGSMQGDRLLMRFTVPLAEAVDPRAAAVSYAVYDPTFYIEILHEQADPVALEGAAPADCGFELRPPEPDEEIVSFAASLDRTQSGGDGLGVHFAEWVSLSCKAEG